MQFKQMQVYRDYGIYIFSIPGSAYKYFIAEDLWY